uniref:L1 transposable element RRM domain-containing protein n=1 Tax=Poecilia reticulata TaxID=8081 RepID=A0A3P9PX26_POERE
MPGPRKPSKDKSRITLQFKLTDYGPLKAEPSTNKASKKVSKEPNSSKGVDGELAANNSEMNNSLCDKAEILGAIKSLKSDLSERFDGVMTAIEAVGECAKRLTQAEEHLSTVEDEQLPLINNVTSLEETKKRLEEKMVDMEIRSRLNNLRLVNLPEGAEGSDACEFLESWLPEVLEQCALRNPLILERAHRVGPNRNAEDTILKASRAKTDILYKNQRVRLYNDVSADIHKQPKQYDGVHKRLRELGLRHGIIPPAKLILTYQGEPFRFNTPAEVQAFIDRTQRSQISVTE